MELPWFLRHEWLLQDRLLPLHALISDSLASFNYKSKSMQKNGTPSFPNNPIFNMLDSHLRLGLGFLHSVFMPQLSSRVGGFVPL
jgi:hypothetical protein